MKNNRKTLLIRADAGVDIGTGHLMRCLALAQAWQDMIGEAIFITSCDSEPLLQRLRDEGNRVVELEKTYPDNDGWEVFSKVLQANPDTWVVLDGYHFDSAYQRRLKGMGHSLLVIDDMAHMDHYYADVVLNQNIQAEELDYSTEPTTQLLLGTDYVMLRSEFWHWISWKREIPEVALKILITLGGADPDNQTLKVIRALQYVGGLEGIVVVGASNPHYDALDSAVRHSLSDIRLVHNTSNMPELMTWADVAVTAGGSTCWETAFLGLPNVLLVLADNQKGIAEKLDRVGVAYSLGWYGDVTSKRIAKTLSKLIIDQKQRQEMRTNGQNLIDGKGVKRVVSILAEG